MFSQASDERTRSVIESAYGVRLLYHKFEHITIAAGDYNRKVCPPSLACRLGRCFCFAEVSTGHPHPLRRRVPYIRSVGVKISH